MAVPLIAMAVFQMISGAQTAETMREAALLGRQVSELNAKYAELDAYHATQQGYSEEARYQTVIDNMVSDQRSAYAAQNVDINFGTAKAVQEESRIIGFLNKLDLRNQAHDKSLGYMNEASNMRMQGLTNQSQANYNAQAVQSAATLSAAGTALQGFSGYSKSKTTPSKNSHFGASGSTFNTQVAFERPRGLLFGN